MHLGGRIGLRPRRIMATIPLPKLRITCSDDEYLRMFTKRVNCMSFKAETTVYGSLAANVTNGHTKVETAKDTIDCDPSCK